MLESVTDTPGRLLRLLSLLQTPREWPGSELAERLAVSPRTIRRDVDRLRDLGYPVAATLGVTGGYRLVAGAALPPLLLDDEEAVAVAVGLRTAARQAVTGIEEAALRALTKLDQVLPSRLRYRVRNLTAATVPMAPFGAPDPVDPDVLTTLAAAISGRQRVRFGYRSHDGTESRRHVDPYRLVAAGHRWYLVGYDNDRDDWRIYRVDRLADASATGVRAVPRDLPAADAAAYVHEKLYALAPTYRAVATLHAPVAEVRGRVGDGELTPVDERTCRLVSHVDTLDWLAFRLTTLGCEVEVHEPPELRNHLRDLAGRALRASTGQSRPGL
ncbi:Predicted DNA-binding transcriptional regulator YafY, contains an HTH and WYL domains [Micromonospora inositola]|uniref:Predicted DNA-binding transcriptional regulator YafY, contains an HTH and WYL domains n=1 Tax=Micromonospora inositola TaxID=47865 RepID=A0A1C5H6X1_9ACTN|nr:Predicted DNA-binding transcriptional regulator YafY, contains an HTH and WYL domains [Micromonospora inositola]